MIWASTLHDNVCVRHARWVGAGTTFIRRQVDLRRAPEVVRAHIRNLRLLRRHGTNVVTACHLECGPLWRELLNHHYQLWPTHHRTQRLDPLHEYSQYQAGPYYLATIYPETVEAVALFASPIWRERALSNNRADLDRFVAEFVRRLPQERKFRTTAQPWFRMHLRAKASRIRNRITTGSPQDPLQDDHAKQRTHVENNPVAVMPPLAEILQP
ncbi:hypothetical protein [Yinghuangia sp. YIM S09857]|uniref:hypothetical protein n=1 Tax=Yinghuangia sp. YIM S09857 TaxID=3436929 RepID=UPI003F534044